MDKITTGSFFVSVLLVPEPMISQVYVLAVVETLMKRTYGGVAEESNVHDGGDCGRSSCVRKFAKGRRVYGKTHIKKKIVTVLFLNSFVVVSRF